jgi:hypothetical protein
LAALVDGQVLGPHRLARAAGLRPTDLDTALFDLELAGLVRRTAAGIQAIALPPALATHLTTAPIDPVPGSPLSRNPRPPPSREPRGPPPAVSGTRPQGGGLGEVLECGHPGGDHGGDG